MISITPRAILQLKELSLEQGVASLRLSVEKGGCAGLQYVMSLGDPLPEDHRVECDGAVVSVESQSLPFLEGCSIDYVDGLTGSGFRILNPSATRSCGCGTSFEPSRTPVQE